MIVYCFFLPFSDPTVGLVKVMGGRMNSPELITLIGCCVATTSCNTTVAALIVCEPTKALINMVRR